MTEVLFHDISFGQNSLTVESTMEYHRNSPEKVKEVDKKEASGTGNMEEVEVDDDVDITEHSDDTDSACDEPLDVGTEDLNMEYEHSKELSTEYIGCAIKKDTSSIEGDGGNGNQLKQELIKSELIGSSCSEEKLEKAIEGFVKPDNCDTNENATDAENQTVDDLKAKDFNDLVEHSSDVTKRELDVETELKKDCDEEIEGKQFPSLRDGENSYKNGTKHERKSDKTKRGSGYTRKKVGYLSAELSNEDEMCFTDESDLDIDNEDFDQRNLLLKTVSESCAADEKDLLKFAEVLYKCTLCTSIPSILTSEESFIQHVNKHHLSKDTHTHTCKLCFFKFRTEEDLKEHIIYSHTGSDENLSCDLTGSDVAGSHDQMIDSNNDSDSDSSGHRQLRTKVVKRVKPVNDFESPKQLVDHTGIETLNGSLDLTQKTVEDRREEERLRYTKSLKESGEINIKQITDQIIKSDVQGRSVSNSGNTVKLPFVPSSTTEFGKFTKLVREGGNIVYFCQICNWKSPIKTTFQVHCNMLSHKSKVASAENPDESGDAKSLSPKQCEKSTSQKLGTETRGDNHDSKRQYSAQDISLGPRMPEQNLFYNYIMRPRSGTQCRARTPVVSPYGASNFIEDARYTYKRPNEHPVDLAMRKRKRFLKHSKFGHSSDSDSDDCTKGKKYSNNSSHSTNMNLLRQKLLEGNSGSRHGCSSYQGNTGKGYCKSNFPTDLTIASTKTKNSGYLGKKSDLLNMKKETVEYPVNENSEFSSDLNFLTKLKNFSRKERENAYKARFENGFKGDNKCPRTYQCHACPFRYFEVEEYERHFEKVHKSSFGTYLREKESLATRGSQWSLGNKDLGLGSRFVVDSGIGSEGTTGKNGEPAAVTGSSEMGENWRVQKLKEMLPDYVIECERGNTSRDYLLQCISTSSGIHDALLWSSACNRAMRELFPNSQAQRKGKYKKTYYFGISMLDAYQVTDELPGTEVESPLYQPHRDINVDMEKIVEHIPNILKWTGNMENGVYRQDLLILLTDTIQDSDVSNWGAQCNRAIRLVFPNIDMKRKGKFKTTMYLGVEFQADVLKKLSQYTNSSVDIQPTETGGKSSGDIPANSVLPTEQKRGRTLERLLTRDSNSPENVLQFGGMSAKNSLPVLAYPQWMKREAQDEMGQYIAKFGGVAMFDSQTGCQNKSAEVGEQEDDTRNSGGPVVHGDNEESSVGVTVDQGDDNDGDDEGESLDSVQIQ